MNTDVVTGLEIALGAAVIGLFVWSVQRIIGRIDRVGDQLIALATRVTVIETKQDGQIEVALQSTKVARKTAAKVGVRLPADLEDTIDPRRRVSPIR